MERPSKTAYSHVKSPSSSTEENRRAAQSLSRPIQEAMSAEPASYCYKYLEKWICCDRLRYCETGMFWRHSPICKWNATHTRDIYPTDWSDPMRIAYSRSTDSPIRSYTPTERVHLSQCAGEIMARLPIYHAICRACEYHYFFEDARMRLNMHHITAAWELYLPHEMAKTRLAAGRGLFIHLPQDSVFVEREWWSISQLLCTRSVQVDEAYYLRLRASISGQGDVGKLRMEMQSRNGHEMHPDNIVMEESGPRVILGQTSLFSVIREQEARWETYRTRTRTALQILAVPPAGPRRLHSRGDACAEC